jgi:hypothetical protein
MMFAVDRDVAVLEPTVYKDVQWQTTTYCTGLGALNGLLLEGLSYDQDFLTALVPSGAVAVVGGVCAEVLSSIDFNVIMVGKLRASVQDVSTPLGIAGTVAYSVHSFRPQILWAHQQLMAMAGLLPTQQEKVLNPADAARLEAMLTLAIVYSAAAGTELSNGAYAQRAAMYRRRFAEERQRTMLLLDHDGDGKVDEQRLLHAGRMMRG